MTFTAYVQFDTESSMYVGIVPGLPGAHSQGKTLDELHRNLTEAIELVVGERRARGESVDVDPFVGIQQVQVSL
jgi:predicted RNase H-like HicB family nuclease